ncbi:MAG: phosphotransferase [Desulfomonile sp.]|jgi:hypothetical protein
MDDENRREYSLDLQLEITSLALIKENKYCVIYLAGTPDGPRIVKKYRGGDSSLVMVEADALGFYHHLAQDEPNLIDSGEPLLREDRNLLCIGFVEGDAFSEVLYKARKDDSLRDRSVRIMSILGNVIRTIYEKTQRPQEETSPFIFEYFNYCSTRLEQMPLLGPILFKGMSSEAERLSNDFRLSNIVPSFIHGDFVFKNIHIKDERVGLIDFANANSLSHPLNDIYNLRFALANMLLPKKFKADLLAGFYDGLGSTDFPEIAQWFYYEYHRRRWLMLKLSSRIPADLIQGLRGLLSFAKPFTAEDKAV